MGKQKTFLSVIIIWSSFLIGTNFYSYIYYNPLHFNTFVLVGVYLLIMILIPTKYIHTKTPLDKIVVWTLITIFLSFIPAYIDYQQSIIGTFISAIVLSSGVFLYFVFRKLNTTPELIMKILTVACLIWVILEIGQQFTYPNYLFSGRANIQGLAERMGLWRYYIWGIDFVLMVYAYWIGQTFSNNNISKNKAFIVALIFLAGLLCYVSRKHIYVSLLAFILPYVPFFRNGKTKIGKIQLLMTCLFLFLVFYNFYDSFSEMNQAANEAQGEGEDFIRLLAANYFLYDFSDSPLYPIFGAGLPYDGSMLAKKIDYLANMFGDFTGFYQADVGIIGYYSKFGLLGVSAIAAYIYYFFKNWKYIDLWYKLFFTMKLLLIVFDFWGMWQVGMMAYGFFLYLLNENIKKNKKEMMLWIKK